MEANSKVTSIVDRITLPSKNLVNISIYQDWICISDKRFPNRILPLRKRYISVSFHCTLKVSGFCVIEINEAKRNPGWGSPSVLDPMSFFKPGTVGDSVVYYPSPPYQYDLTVKLENAIREQAG
ncbi:hypothetical protein QAD02_022882 [Eretmocerus hayati]|uniref:Uncharacterized protein n=1 Tax=Eretmocerus hayati TaxID=131215 RepID=A0ACC2PVV6_9HYME|nr:hypothetical protein QAD02_022882 [Eretmocerus hayati]